MGQTLWRSVSSECFMKLVKLDRTTPTDRKQRPTNGNYVSTVKLPSQCPRQLESRGELLSI